MFMHAVPRRLSVIGTTGSGKTTLARKIAACLNISHIELDAIHWGPNWEPLDLDEFRAQISLALEGHDWVIDGNYSKVRDIVWSRADTVVWLDYGLPRVLYQLLQRTLHRVITRQVLWNENREHFHSQFLSRDSLFLWAVKTYPKQREIYPRLFMKPEYNHLHIVRLHSPKATEKWLQKM
jgi:adenylate kinase family enzyme